MSLRAGARLGKYDVVGPLGAGGMGEVYRARDPRLGRDVALKLLPESYARDPDRLARFEREARTLARLNHPNIVTIYDVEESDGVRFLAMELVEGRTLAAMMPPGGFALDRLIELGVQVADALAAAHDKGIVHRDLKPGNVMVNDAGRVKVLDFGLAKLGPGLRADGTGETTAATVTEDGSMLGTLPYMAPEVLRGGTADTRSDLFSLGVLLHEMATGRRPFEGTSGIAVAAAILQSDAPPLEQLKPDWPARLARIVGRCLEKDPRRRTQSALDVSHELQDLAQESPRRPSAATAPTATPMPGAGSRPSAARARRWWPAGLAVAGFVLVAVAAWTWRGVWEGLRPGRSGRPEIHSIAVLPFGNLMNDPSQDYFVDGMHEALITDLAKLGVLRVTSRSSVLRYKGSQRSLKEVARELGVDALIEGSILRAGDRVRITAQLIRGDTDEHLWAESYDRDLRDVLALLDEVSGAIVREVGVAVRPRGEGSAVPSVAARVRPEAYEEYLRARQSELSLKSARDYVTRTLPHLERAVELDPGFADAWGALALVKTYSVFFGLSPAEEALARARDAAERALALDQGAGEALAALGTIALYFDWNFPAAGRQLERAVTLRPHNANVRHTYADYLMLFGRAQEGLEQVRTGLRDNPEYLPFTAVVCFHAIFARQYAEAERIGRRFLADVPGRYPTIHNALAEALWLQGRTDEALDEYRRRWGETSDAARVFEAAFRRSGPRAAMRAVADLLARSVRPESGAAVDIAAQYAQAGEHDAAFKWLDRAFATRQPQLLHAAVHPYFDPLRDDPRFAALMQRVGLPNVDPRVPQALAPPKPGS